MERQIVCPQCRQGGALRVQVRSPREFVASLLWMAPFQCQRCDCRFLARRMSSASFPRLAERREHMRIPVRLCLSFSGGRVRGEGIVLDLSLGGCIIQSEAHVRVDDIFYLEISLAKDEPPIEAAAIVRSVSARGIAFKFLRRAQEDKRLMAFIQTHAGSNPSVSIEVAQSSLSN
ncbi:MAG: PilZ domain-containing protein [Nitrospira sp.]|nr:PilZ domain-containing protein [Nitrospira sp.]MBS0153744.1 PilZ domain-containing protein [Nitrospira sp.]MBS0164825.1 PilZ domain-containing protein [Nitrospira sp.]MBX3326084.1 PilZ domain-containing protein [Nitrospira sp.]